MHRFMWQLRAYKESNNIVFVGSMEIKSSKSVIFTNILGIDTKMVLMLLHYKRLNTWVKLESTLMHGVERDNYG